MPVINGLIWLHFVGLVVGFGGGIGMSQVGPRLVKAPPDQREPLWPMYAAFNRMAMIGLGLMLITGPAVVALKFGGPGALGLWFDIKILLIILALMAIGFSHMGKAKFRRGDEGAAAQMVIGGCITGGLLVLTMLAAVMAFN